MTETGNTTSMLDLLRRTYGIVRPYGRRRIAAVIAVSSVQALAQLVSVATLLPFLALATDPGAFAESAAGNRIMSLLPGWSENELLIGAGGLVIAGLLAANGLSLFGEYYRMRFIWGFAHWLRMRMMWGISSHSYSWFAGQNSSILLKKTTQDINDFTTGILSPIVDATSRFLTSILLIGGIVLVDPQLALLVGALLVVLYTTIFLALRSFRQRISAVMKRSWRGLYQNATQYLTGIKPARVHGVEAELLGRIEENSRHLTGMQKWMPVIGNTPRYLLEPIVFGAIIAVVMFALAGGESLNTLLPSLGFVAFAGYRLLPAVQMLYGHLSNISSMRHAFEELYDELRAAEMELIDRHKRLAAHHERVDMEGPFSLHQSITLEHVTYQYPGPDQPVIKDISLEIPMRSSVALVGESGAGKSTLVDLILGLHHPTSGKVMVDGRSILSEDDVRAWQDHIGYVPQDIFLTDDTITRNIAFGIPDVEIDQARVREVAEMAQLADFIETRLPDGFDTHVGERGIQLSGGQRQRIALARALYHRPQVLILDEATSALDNETEARFMDVVYALSDELTIIMIAHRLSSIERCETVFRIEDGQLVETLRPGQNAGAGR